jgi:tetratricopeptide (TPR) repeat protein
MQARVSAVLANGSPEDAVKVLKKYLAQNPNDPVGHFNIGVMFLKLRRNSEALRHLHRSLQLNPAFSQSYIAIGNILIAQGDDDGAVGMFERAIAINPGSYVAFNNLGEVQLRQGEYAASLVNFTRALSLAPNEVSVLFNHARALETCGELTAAFDAYQRVVAVDPKHADALAQLTIVATEINPLSSQNAQDALTHIKRALELQPQNMRYLARYAAFCGTAGLEDERRQAVQRLLEITPNSAEGVGARASGFLMDGRPQDAFAVVQDTLSIMPFDELPRLRGTSEQQIKPLSACEGRVPEKSDRLLIFVAADGKYAELYAEKFVASVLAASPDCDIHLHLIDPGAYQPAEALSRFPSGRVTWSSEEIDGGPKKTIYASRRFVRLPELLRLTGRTIVCVDIDSIVNGDISLAIDGMQAFDVLLYERPHEIALHCMVAAGFVAMTPTVAAIGFADFVASYILHFENAGTSKWFVDQVALIAAKTWYATNGDAAIRPAPARFLNWSVTPDPESLIWTAKGQRKRLLGQPA